MTNEHDDTTRRPRRGDTCTRCGERIRFESVRFDDAGSRLERVERDLTCACFAGPTIDT